MSKIKGQETIIEMLTIMSEGNPGALSALVDIIEKHDGIDPQAMMGGIGAILILDTWEIYGTDIYILYSDKCGKDVRKMLMLMRATQLGLFPHTKLQKMAHDQMREVNLSDEEFSELDQKVCEQLEDFMKPVLEIAA